MNREEKASEDPKKGVAAGEGAGTGDASAAAGGAPASGPGAGTAAKRGLKPTYIPRLMIVGMIIILLMVLIPVLREKKPAVNPLAQVDPPLLMERSTTGFASTDSLVNGALRCFDRKDYTEATHLLSKVYFYWDVQIRTGKMRAFPEDLRYYLGLSELFRGRPDRAVPYLEAEARAKPFEEKYAWYLAHAYIALGDYAKARASLEQVARIGDPHADEARAKIGLLPAAPDSSAQRAP